MKNMVFCGHSKHIRIKYYYILRLTTCFYEVLLLLRMKIYFLLLTSVLRGGSNIPTSFGETKNTLCVLGIDYENIYVCSKDCL